MTVSGTALNWRDPCQCSLKCCAQMSDNWPCCEVAGGKCQVCDVRVHNITGGSVVLLACACALVRGGYKWLSKWCVHVCVCVCVCVCLPSLCRDNGGHQVVFQGHWWWNMAASLGVQVLLHLTHKRFITNTNSDKQPEWYLGDGYKHFGNFFQFNLHVSHIYYFLSYYFLTFLAWSFIERFIHFEAL